MRMIQRWADLIMLGVLAITVAGFVACHPPASVHTPAGQHAYTADQVIKHIAEFQQVVIDAADSGKMTNDQAKVIVQWCVTSLKAIKQTPNGWAPAAYSTWQSIRPLVVSQPSIATWLPIIDGILGSTSGGI